MSLYIIVEDHDRGNSSIVRLRFKVKGSLSFQTKNMTIEDDIDAQVKAALAGTIPAVPGIIVKSSELYGGKGGEMFDDGIHKHISKINIKSGQVIDNISIVYDNGTLNRSLIWCEHGGDGGEDHLLELKSDEYVTQVVVRAGRMVQSLEFRTNLGRLLTCGGKHNVGIAGFKPKEVVESGPNKKYGLVGIHGRKGKYIDAIGFHWGQICQTADI